MWNGVVRAVVAVAVGPVEGGVASICGADGVRAKSGIQGVGKGEG